MLATDRKSTRLNSSHTEIYTLSLHDALPISVLAITVEAVGCIPAQLEESSPNQLKTLWFLQNAGDRSEEHTSELQSHRDLHSFPTRRSSDLGTGYYSGSGRMYSRAARGKFT